MPSKTHFILQILLILSLFLRPPSTVAQTGESFKGNTGGFTPSTIIIIIIALVFMVTGFLAIFLRQFSDGCFGLNVQSINPAVTADGRPVARGLHTDVIRSFPCYVYSDVKQHRLGKVELECAVCLSEFQDSESLRLLPVCSHVFHPRCIDLWLASHVTCPICRQSLEPGASDHELTPCSIINIPPITTVDQDHHGDDDPQSTAEIDREELTDDTKVKKMEKMIGKFPRSHSTGHSLADSERFTLRLPEDVQCNLVNRSICNDDERLSSTVNPRCGWFSMTPPNFGPVRSNSVIISGSKKTSLSPVKTSDRLWPI